MASEPAAEAGDAGKNGETGPVRGPTVRNDLRGAIFLADAVNLGISAPRKVAPTLQWAADVDAELRRYVRPGTFEEAARRLRTEHVVVVQGPPGLGRGTAALALLRAVVDGDLEPVSPATPLDELRKYEFGEIRGYYLPDYAFPAGGAEAEYEWGRVNDCVRQSDAYLVVTAMDTPRYVRSLTWERPPLTRLLEALLEHRPGTVTPELTDRIPDDWSLTDVAEMARRLTAAPADVDAAVSVFDLTAAAEVRAWFAEPHRELLDYVEVAALAFAWGSSSREFESTVAALERSIARHLPVSPDPENGKDQVLRRRERRSVLISEERVSYSGIPRQVLVFRSRSHCRLVLEGLWRSQSVPFWDGLRDWAHDRVVDETADQSDLIQIAQGVALLAEVDLEEAVGSYLNPFVAIPVSANGMVCASSVLRLMAFDDTLAPVALRIGAQWIGGSLNQRIAAGEALVAELGAQYPAEAARRLWQLISQDRLLDDIAYTAPAGLLQTLVELEGDAVPLLELLCDRVIRLAARRDPENTDRVLRTVQCLLETTVESSTEPASFRLLLTRPETAGYLARLWAALLDNLRYRAGALSTLWDGLAESRDRAKVAGALTDALAGVLSTTEQHRFVESFTVIDRRKRLRDPQRIASLSHLFIDAMARVHGGAAMETR